MTSTISSEQVLKAVEAARPAIERICAEVWDLAEVSLEEVGSALVHRRELEQAGFTIISTGTAGEPTAFVAEWSQGVGGARIGFLPEYDALPGLGNAAVSRQQPWPMARPAATAAATTYWVQVSPAQRLLPGRSWKHKAFPAPCASSVVLLRKPRVPKSTWLAPGYSMISTPACTGIPRQSPASSMFVWRQAT